jgi:hypothetical protein
MTMLDSSLRAAAVALDEHAESFAVNSDEPWIKAWDHAVRESKAAKVVLGETYLQPQPGLFFHFIAHGTASGRRSAFFEMIDEFSRVDRLPRQVIRRRLRLVAMAQIREAAEKALLTYTSDERSGIDQAVPRGTEFGPSRELTNYWVRGLRDHLNEIATPTSYKVRWDRALEDNEAPKALAVRLKRLFAVVGHRQAYGIEPKEPLAIDGRFSLLFQHHIIDRIPLRPDEYANFFRILWRELEAFLRGGGQVKGSWGELELYQSSLRIRFKETKSAMNEQQGWSRAQVLK